MKLKNLFRSKKGQSAAANGGGHAAGDGGEKEQKQRAKRGPDPAEKSGKNDVKMPIIPQKFAKYLEDILVQKVEALPAGSEDRAKAFQIVQTFTTLLDTETREFDQKFIQDLSFELTNLLEGGPKIEEVDSEEEEGGKRNKSSNNGLKMDPSHQSLMLQLAKFVAPLQQAAPQQLPVATIPNLLQTQSPTMTMANVFDSKGGQNLEMALNPVDTPDFKGMNFELAKANMDMGGASSAVESALKKSYSGTGAKGCEVVGQIETEQNITAREGICQAQITLRHHSTDMKEQNIEMILAKKEMALKGIEAGKAIAEKQIDAQVETRRQLFLLENNKIDKTHLLAKQQLEGSIIMGMEQFRQQNIQLEHAHAEKREQLKNAHETNMVNMRQEHEIRIAKMGPQVLTMAQHWDKQRNEHELRKKSNDKDVLEHKLKEKIVDYDKKLEMKKMELKQELEKKKMENQHEMAMLQKKMDLLKMQQQQQSSNLGATTSQQQSPTPSGDSGQYDDGDEEANGGD